MRRILILLFACSACEPSKVRAVTEADLLPHARAQTSLAPAPSDGAVVFQCLQDDSGRVRLTGILRQRMRVARSAAGSARRVDTLVVLETPMRTVDCQNRAGGQPPPELEPRSLITLRGTGPALRAFVGDTVLVFGASPARNALLDAEPLLMRLDSMRVTRADRRVRVGADGALLP